MTDRIQQTFGPDFKAPFGRETQQAEEKYPDAQTEGKESARGHAEMYSTLNAEKKRSRLQKGEDRNANLEGTTQTT